MDDQLPQVKTGPKQPLLTRAEMVIIVVLSALLAAGVVVLEIRDWARAWNAVRIDRSGRVDTQYLIDLNTASWEELALLPGIGEVKAKGIIAHRERIGGFKSPEQLGDVKGIRKDMLAKILPLVTVWSSEKRREQ
jgi:competence ComEA-like helix-hairpin-helix protein